MKYINEWSVEVNPIEIKMSGVWRFLNVFRGLGPLCGMLSKQSHSRHSSREKVSSNESTTERANQLAMLLSVAFLWGGAALA